MNTATVIDNEINHIILQNIINQHRFDILLSPEITTEIQYTTETRDDKITIIRNPEPANRITVRPEAKVVFDAPQGVSLPVIDVETFEPVEGIGEFTTFIDQHKELNDTQIDELITSAFEELLSETSQPVVYTVNPMIMYTQDSIEHRLMISCNKF